MNGSDEADLWTATVEAEERIELLSVGVDIGSATSHLVISELELRKRGTRYVVTRRSVRHESPVILTPYSGALSIDGKELSAFITAQYREAGVDRASIDTGALILTGVALLRENARTIAETFAEEAGRMVAVSAGDTLEAVMAAHGSGAVALSRTRGRVLNVDVGGGTTKLAVCADGRVEATAALDVGARAIVRQPDGVVARIEQPGRLAAELVGAEVRVGRAVDSGPLDAMLDVMAGAVIDASPLCDSPARSTDLDRSGSLVGVEPVASVVFSGGVSEYIYGRERSEYGDLGPQLAARLAAAYRTQPVHIADGQSGIRATVLGASQYTAQVSGSTIFLSDRSVLPLRNVPVVAPSVELGPCIDEPALAEAVQRALVAHDLHRREGAVAIAMPWRGMATSGRLEAVASAVIRGASKAGLDDDPLVVVTDDDVGRLLGRYLAEAAGERPVLSLDGIDLADFEFIDVGRPIPGSNVVPVVIKSLVFPVPTGAP